MTETSEWLLRASALQRYVGYTVPLDQLTLTATHNSFTTDYDLSTHSNFEVLTAQIFEMTEQLSCLGVRGLELDPHFIAELVPDDIDDGGGEESAIRLCHTRPSVAEDVRTFCSLTGWTICNNADVFDFGDDTLCRPSARTVRDGFEEIATWLFSEENLNEFVFIKLDSFLDDQIELVSTIAEDVFGRENIFAPADLDEFSQNVTWPCPTELVQMGTRVVFAGTEPSSLVFSRITEAIEVNIAPENFDPSTCPDVEGYPQPSWHRVQGDVVTIRATVAGFTVFEVEPEDEEILMADTTASVIECGFTPTFDRMDAELMESKVWSWAVGRPETTFTGPRAAVASASVDGTARWTDIGVDEEEHSYACRNPENRTEWQVVPIGTDGCHDGRFDEAASACESIGFVFGAPRTAFENVQLGLAILDAGVNTSWIAYTSDGGKSSLCWAHDGHFEYCSPDFTGSYCTNTPEPVTEFVDNELDIGFNLPFDDGATVAAPETPAPALETSALTAAPTAVPTPCPDGIEGINERDIVCCSLSCGTCAREGCPDRPGGPAGCCGDVIKDSLVFCADSGAAPCIISLPSSS